MTEAEFKKLLKPDRYQVFLFACPAQVPAVFAIHPWLVVNQQGNISRWEVIYRRDTKTGTYISKNELPYSSGIQIFPFVEIFFWKGILSKVIEGNEGSGAAQMAEFITSSPDRYKFARKYHLLGPNSNTYVQWILNTFPDSGMRLPWNAIGKNFKVIDEF